MKKLFLILIFLNNIFSWAPEVDLSKKIDVDKKISDLMKLISEAESFFLANKPVDSFKAFSKDKKWKSGDLYIFIIDDKGACLASGDDYGLIWNDLNAYKTIEGVPLANAMFSRGTKGGWISYLWNNSYKWSFVKVVKKDKREFVIGAGFFPDSSDFLAEQMVLSAASQLVRSGPQQVFSMINNPNGPFIKGHIYLSAYDLNGKCLADTANQIFVGQNLLGQVDEKGHPIVAKFIEVAKSLTGNGWVGYIWKGMPKKTFVTKVEDPKTNKVYIIAGGSYPGINEEFVKGFVAKGIQYMQFNGLDAACKEFSSSDGSFIKGPLTIFVYDFEGKLLADGDRPKVVGQDLKDYVDAEGKNVFQAILKEIKQYGKGWITLIDKNDYKNVYVEKVSIVDGDFIIGSGFFPNSKEQNVRVLVSKAFSQFKSGSVDNIFKDLTSGKGDYFWGDLYMFVYDIAGNCYAMGSHKNYIWENFIDIKDESGKKIVDIMISIGRAGGGWFEYNVNNGIRRVYVRSVIIKMGDKDSEFIIGSGYYM